MKTAALAAVLGGVLSALAMAALTWAGESARTKNAAETPDQSRERHDAQVCLLGSKSCIDMDPRSFEVCLAGADRCDQSYSIEQIQFAAAPASVPDDTASSQP